MLHHNFKLEVFKRYLFSQPDKLQEVAIETFQYSLNSHYKYDVLHQKFVEFINNRKNHIKIPTFSLINYRNKQYTLHEQLLKYKLCSATQTLEQLQVENQKLRELIKKVGLIIIDFFPQMFKQMAAKFDALIDEMVEK